MTPRPRAALALTLLALLAAPPRASANRAPPAGTPAPGVTLLDPAAREVTVPDFAPGTRVLIFGDLDHEGVRRAIDGVLAVTADPRHADDPITTALILHAFDPELLKREAAIGNLPRIILHDPDRRAFGAYRILVMPTVVVVAPDGTVVHALSGPVKHFNEDLGAALLLAAGRMTDEQFQRLIAPDPANAAVPAATRADRLVNLGHELVRHGLYEMAEARFTEALSFAPDDTRARLGLADVMLHTGRAPEAESAYRAVLADDADSLEAAIGVATAQAMQGGDSLTEAERTADELVARHPSLPQTRFLRGLIYERRGNCPAAMAEFKHAAELAIGP